ncbi:hypothetical protein K502DRAFT_350452 [Neoconidiobolus thromboides FSU 785]|nr:hypothetical protein K502DRAFT_350452 [Neoconidiobolus thromboides FSU 785]
MLVNLLPRHYLPEVRNQFADIVEKNTTMNKIFRDISEVSDESFEVRKISIEANKKRYRKWTYIPQGDSNNLFPDFKFSSIKKYVKQAFFN